MFKRGDRNGGAVVEGNMFVANKDWPGEDRVTFENFVISRTIDRGDRRSLAQGPHTKAT